MKRKLLSWVVVIGLLMSMLSGCGSKTEIIDDSPLSTPVDKEVVSTTEPTSVVPEVLDEPVESEEEEKTLYTITNNKILDSITGFVSLIQSAELHYSPGVRYIDKLLESTAQSVNDSALLDIRESDSRIILTQDLYDEKDSELDSFIRSAMDTSEFDSSWGFKILASNINRTFSYYEGTDAKIYMIVNFDTDDDFDCSVNFEDSYCYVTCESKYTYDRKKDYTYDIVDGHVIFDYYHYFDFYGDFNSGKGNYKNVIDDDGYMFIPYHFCPWYFELVCSSEDPTKWLINDIHRIFDQSFESSYETKGLNYLSGYINDCMCEDGKYYYLLVNKLVNEGEPEQELIEAVDVPEDWKQRFLNSEDFITYCKDSEYMDFDYILLDITEDGVPELFLVDTRFENSMLMFSFDADYSSVRYGGLGFHNSVGLFEDYLIGETMRGAGISKINKGTSTFTYCPFDEATGDFYDPDNSEYIIDWDWDSVTRIYQLGLTSTAQQSLEDAILNYNN